MKRNTYVRLVALLLFCSLALAGCRQQNPTAEIEGPQPSTEPTQLTIAGVPQDIVNAFLKVHQRLEDGTLQMRTYDLSGVYTQKPTTLNDLVGAKLAGFRGATVTAIEADELQSYYSLINALQPTLLVPCDEEPVEWVRLAYVFDTPKDGAILRVGFNIGSLSTTDSDDGGLTLVINGSYFECDVAYYRILRPFLPEKDRAAYDKDFSNWYGTEFDDEF